MFDSGSLYVIQWISGVDGAEYYNFFFSLVSAAGLIAVIPAAIMKLIQRA